jgi:hypothetical protein
MEAGGAVSCKRGVGQEGFSDATPDGEEGKAAGKQAWPKEPDYSGGSGVSVSAGEGATGSDAGGTAGGSAT